MRSKDHRPIIVGYAVVLLVMMVTVVFGFKARSQVSRERFARIVLLCSWV